MGMCAIMHLPKRAGMQIHICMNQNELTRQA